jgi:hypothetical protein
VDAEGGPVHRAVALHHVAVVVDQEQVRHLDLVEAQAERIDPEPVRELRVARGDVPGHALGEAELAEQPERRGQFLLAVQALLRRRREHRPRPGPEIPAGGGPVHSGHAGFLRCLC